MTLSDDDFNVVQRLIREEAGLQLDIEKNYLVESRLSRLALTEGDGDIQSLLARVREGEPRLRTAVTEALTIQETYFFRDSWFFEALRDEVLPALIAARRRERRLGIWCAACATGQEVYSLCLLLREHFPELEGWQLDVLASDYSATALVQAQSGRYSTMEANRGLPALLLAKHFERDGTYWRIAPQLRAMVRFDRINLVAPWPELPRFDIVLLRNVLFYFDDATRRDVLVRVHGRLRDDGYLFLGGTESPSGLVDSFTTVSGGRGGYYRTKQREYGK